jgi:hypothetical protein
MKLNAPKQLTWLIALTVGLLGLIGTIISIPGVSGVSFWFVVFAWALLLVASAVKGL